MKCRLCNKKLLPPLLDLGAMPIANNLSRPDDLSCPVYPLALHVCDHCYLAQHATNIPNTQIFHQNYPYFSSCSTTWLKHSQALAQKLVRTRSLNDLSQVVELGSNDGCLLQYFKKESIPTLGIEPSASVAKKAQEKGIETIVEFFSLELAQKISDRHADVIVASNMLAHDPNIRSVVEGMKILLKPAGVIVVEVAYLPKLIEQVAYDTIYHEHYFYYSLYSIMRLFAAHDLSVYDAELLPTHGGSLRIYATHLAKKPNDSPRLKKIQSHEADIKINSTAYYQQFASRAIKNAQILKKLLTDLKSSGARVAGYGAPAKAITLTNFAQIDASLVSFTVDKNPTKQNHTLPISNIPILNPTEIKKQKPTHILIFPWNIQKEIMKEHAYIKQWGGKWVIPIPDPHVV